MRRRAAAHREVVGLVLDVQGELRRLALRDADDQRRAGCAADETHWFRGPVLQLHGHNALTSRHAFVARLWALHHRAYFVKILLNNTAELTAGMLTHCYA
jgi:hypothetical protein